MKRARHYFDWYSNTVFSATGPIWEHIRLFPEEAPGCIEDIGFIYFVETLMDSGPHGAGVVKIGWASI